jgi:hypothetical protein
MELANLKSYQRTIASVQLPLLHFVETGFWNPYALPDWTENDIGDTFVRRATRHVAKELKRPFIQCYAILGNKEYDAVTGKYVPVPEPRFTSAFIEVPRRKYLMPLVAPLLLAAGESEPLWQRNMDRPVWQSSCATLWQFRFGNRTLWDEYYAFVLNDPDCRKARKLAPL